ncbi:MAG: hypothetical protein AB1762_00355 [Gemmatimonadota bacterium]
MNSESTLTVVRQDQEWQRRMLPIMVQMVIGLAVFFFVVSLVQLTYLNNTIRSAPDIDLEPAFAMLEKQQPTTEAEHLRAVQLRILATMDKGTMQRRYHQTNAALMARIWTRYMAFVTGMILALLGAVFILGKLKEAAPSGNGAARLTSPGLYMIGMGVTLMIVSIFVNHRIDVRDVPDFLQTFNMPAPAASEFQEKPPESVPRGQ